MTDEVYKEANKILDLSTVLEFQTNETGDDTIASKNEGMVSYSVFSVLLFSTWICIYNFLEGS